MLSIRAFGRRELSKEYILHMHYRKNNGGTDQYAQVDLYLYCLQDKTGFS